ncbi:HAD-IC family P-type ATPase [Variovorax sp. Sphag1AA]|uniref:HAD-IC family P-type ATPase n=1 Tax=Variovorax sp. Sphag1AA TaxID=2587027 RepID=UPI0016134495|nr:HAD-IC family P-type ATPase [Variovorax sp. Sphag1AA]MBB3181215.1 H+-transporting ATPase [Variovorax sp. Sphag1AA]
MAAAQRDTTTLDAARQTGLSEAEAQARLRRYGFNEIPEARASLARGVLKRLWGPIPWTLEIALILEVLLGKLNEPLLIGIWLLFSAGVGGVQERRAQRVLDLLRSRLRVNASARRDGTWRIVPARELVPGDEIHLGPGDLVPADCTIAEGTVELDQSALTGESAVVARSVGEVIYSASTVRSGQATATAAATGAKSYYGRTAELVRSARSAGHLDQLLFAVVRRLVTIDALLAALLVVFALWTGADLVALIPFPLVLVIATVPVTMPAAFTVANAVEARTLAQDGVLVTGLSAVQEAATMDVLCIDKTGTLTHNRQVISALVPILEADTESDVLMWAAAACDEASQGQLELSILAALGQRGLRSLERLQLVPFDPALKRAEAYVRRGGQTIRVVLGSPPAVSQIAELNDGLDRRVEELASTGARVLVVAAGPEGGLVIRGLMAFADTLCEDAPALVQAVRRLGVRVLMISGDTVATARAIARQVGLGERLGDGISQAEDPLSFDGFAHCYPQEKFQLVQKLQQAGHVVGMTGDGVNDAPALKQAEVGIAVSSATDVAKGSAQVVLTRPGLHDLIAVISSGRRVYRRMLTWTITKIARTIELAVLLTFGYMITGFFVTSLALIAVLVVLNDVVTITLATDRAGVSQAPEKWSINAIGNIAGILAAGWLILGFAVVWVARDVWAMSIPQTQTLTFVYLIYSAQATIYLTRVRGRLWSSAPSMWVAAATIGNAVIASLMAYFGLLAEPVSGTSLFLLLASVIAAAFVLDECKIAFFRKATQ